MTIIIIMVVMMMIIITAMTMMTSSGAQRHESLLDAAHLVPVLSQFVLGVVLLEEAELL